MTIDKTWDDCVREFAESGRGDLEQLGREMKLICYVSGVQKILMLKDAYEIFCHSHYRAVRKTDEFSINQEGLLRRYVILGVASKVGRDFTFDIMRRQIVMRRAWYQDQHPEERITEDMFVSHARFSRQLMAEVAKGSRFFYCDHEDEKRQDELVYRLNKRVRCILIWGAAAGTNEDEVPYDIFSGPVDDPPADEERAKRRPRKPRSPGPVGSEAPGRRQRKNARPDTNRSFDPATKRISL